MEYTLKGLTEELKNGTLKNHSPYELVMIRAKLQNEVNGLKSFLREKEERSLKLESKGIIGNLIKSTKSKKEENAQQSPSLEPEKKELKTADDYVYDKIKRIESVIKQMDIMENGIYVAKKSSHF